MKVLPYKVASITAKTETSEAEVTLVLKDSFIADAPKQVKFHFIERQESFFGKMLYKSLRTGSEVPILVLEENDTTIVSEE